MDIKFGIHIEPLFGFDYESIERITMHAESLGYLSVWVCDHFFKDSESVRTNSLEAWTVLTALAKATKKMNLGVLVSCNSYRHPALLAKIAASVDMISKGRLILGIGAGWKEIEYRAYGFDFPSLLTRMDQLEEALQIVLSLWTQDRTSFKGTHYTLEDAVFAPKPIQKPHPPILIGGHGPKRTLKMVAKYGNMSNFSPWASDRLEYLLDALRDHCGKVNRDYDSITKTFLGYCLISNDSEEIKEFNLRRAWEQSISLDKYLENQSALPGTWAGDPEDILERYRHLTEMGFSHFQMLFPYRREMEMSKRFSDEIIPRIH